MNERALLAAICLIRYEVTESPMFASTRRKNIEEAFADADQILEQVKQDHIDDIKKPGKE